MMIGILKKKDMENKEKEETIKRLEEIIERRNIKEYVNKVDIVTADGKNFGGKPKFFYVKST